MMIYIGFTPNSQMSRAVIIGIQQLANDSFACLAKVKVGAAINATTAGRIPRKIAAIAGLSMKWWKKSAMSRMMRKEGKIAPKQVQIAPGILRSL